MATADALTLNPGSGGAALDTVDVAVGVQREVVAAGDATTRNAYLLVNADGSLVARQTDEAGNLLRSPKVFKSATATASGNTALWTPATGKRFRLQRLQITVSGLVKAAAAADLDITLQDATTAIGVGWTVSVPATAGTGPGVSTGWIDLGNGVLSAAVNNVLNVNLSVALTGGKVRVTACGVEE